MIRNPAARTLETLMDMHGLSMRVIASVAEISESVIRNFRDIPGRIPNKSTRISIAKALHILTQDEVDIVSLFGEKDDHSYNAEVNSNKNANFSMLLSMRGLRPIQLAAKAGIKLNAVADLLQRKDISMNDLNAIKNCLLVGSDQLGVDFGDKDASEYINKITYKIDEVQDLSPLSSLSYDEIIEYYCHIDDNLLREIQNIASKQEQLLSRLNAIIDGDEGFGKPGTPRRLIFTLLLKHHIDRAVKEMTRPRLSILFNIELIKLLSGNNGAINATHITTFDGSIYIRLASSEERYMEIGRPDPTWRADSINWLSTVLQSIEKTQSLFDKIVITDQCEPQESDLLISRGWIPFEHTFEFHAKKEEHRGADECNP